MTLDPFCAQPTRHPRFLVSAALAVGLLATGCPSESTVDSGVGEGAGEGDGGEADAGEAGETTDGGAVSGQDGGADSCSSCGEAEACCLTHCDGTHACLDEGACPVLDCSERFPYAAASSLSLAEGCGDVLIYALDPGGSVQLTLRLDGPLQDLVDGEQTSTTLTVALPDPAVDLVVEVGSFTNRFPCSEPGSATVDTTWEPVAGQATIELTLNTPDDIFNSVAQVHLESVLLRRQGSTDDDAELDDVIMSDVVVGWYEG